MRSDMVDYHCHLLPSIDDGASDLQESLEIARILSRLGFSTVHCTPHRIVGCYDNDPQRVLRAVESMQRLLDEAGIPLALVPGTEHYFDEFLPGHLPQSLRVGSSKQVLVELPFRAGAELVHPLVDCFTHFGLTPLIAHPERCRAFEAPVHERAVFGSLPFFRSKAKPADLEGEEILRLRRSGCRFQGNIGSFAGHYGGSVKERALLFLKHGIYSCLGSDSHRSSGLGEMLMTGLAVVRDAIGEEEAGRLLCGLDMNE